MKELVKFIVEKITGKDDIKVEQSYSPEGEDNQLLLTIECPKEDIGKVIGKEGRTIKAIRTLVRILAIKENLLINLNIKEV